MASDSPIYSMSVRNPWAFLIIKGHKKVENRHTGICKDRWNQPIALHVPNREYSKTDRHRYYKLPEVQYCLSIDDETKDIYQDGDALDVLFGAMTGSIIGIIQISNTIKALNHSESDQYRFANIPKKAACHWIISEHIVLPSSIKGISGGLGVTQMKDDDVCNQIKTFLADHRLQRQQRNHLFLPQLVSSDPDTYLMTKAKDERVIRIVYDSDDESDFDLVQNERSKSKERQNEDIEERGNEGKKSFNGINGLVARHGKYW